MNDIQVFQVQYDFQDQLDYIESLIISSQLKYLASDLLNEGLTPEYLEEAIHRAIQMSRSAGVDVRKHFKPIYIDRGGRIFKDCKTSKLGLAMILLNANPTVAVAGKFQLRVLEKYFG